MSSTTSKVSIPEQDGVNEEYQAEFTASGMLLIAHTPIGVELPQQFKIAAEGHHFHVTQEGDQFFVDQDDRDAFTAMVFG
ncbi:hypothetical protein HNP46_000239 [Pseudomonas nitritireducens]|uniref:Uncharacterized protein n=1 Tax=Pseudomonas nitroreducens TaxID=46680 RepID=A0A7W7NY83_PSENT|nr:hypothetical protein [Pseudomonas nitritireducens]MBB4861428.1 hypothetical protein [Pseudomonas nitritireducens]